MKKTLIAASVGALMLAAAGTASANSLLFPYFTTAAGAQSVLSLSNTSATAGSFAAADAIHYVYNYGTACTHYDATGAMSANDTLTHSIASPTTAGGFGLAIGNDKSTPVYFPEANKTGFLVVTNKTSTSTTALRGSMAIIDPATGLVVSYAGIDNALNTAVAAAEGNFSAAARGFTETNFALTALPDAFVSTSWYGVAVGNMNAAIVAGADWKGSISFANGGQAWNNDEVSYSGSANKKLVCAGSIVPADLLNSAQIAAIGPNGGMIKATGTVADGASGAVLMKMQAIKPATGGVFVGKQFLHREVAAF